MQAEAFQFQIKLLGEDAVAIVDDEAVGVFEGEELAELLGGPAVALRAWRASPREAISMATKTYTMPKVAVMVTKKSQATIWRAWLWTNVRHRWPEVGRGLEVTR